MEKILTALAPTSSSPREAADALVREGLSASAANDGATAIDLFSKACAAAPELGTAHFLLASELAQAGRWDEAEAAFANTVLVAPEFSIARYQLGLLQFSSGRAALALVTWQALLTLPDQSPYPHFIRGFAALAHDDFGGALQHFEAGLRCEFDNPALRDDVSKIVQRARASLASATAAGATGAESGAKSESMQEHILLSNYVRHGRPH